jgi:hypothetical protein
MSARKNREIFPTSGMFSQCCLTRYWEPSQLYAFREKNMTPVGQRLGKTQAVYKSRFLTSGKNRIAPTWLDVVHLTQVILETDSNWPKSDEGRCPHALLAVISTLDVLCLI